MAELLNGPRSVDNIGEAQADAATNDMRSHQLWPDATDTVFADALRQNEQRSWSKLLL